MGAQLQKLNLLIRLYWLPISAMSTVVVVSNIAVQYPITDWLTWGAMTYPLSFLVTDLTNRSYGPRITRPVVYAGFAIAVVFSIALASPRIAVASGMAFLIAQLFDVYVFNRLRNRLLWWQAPLASSLSASTLDTMLFFSLAFSMTGLPWITWAIGDLAVKAAIALILLIPFRILTKFVMKTAATSTEY